jgi:hypothetical protein
MAIMTRIKGLLIFIMIVGNLIIVFGADSASAATDVILQDDFESGWHNWGYCWDNIGVCGVDYWGLSDYRSHNGSWSAWCAEIGTSAGNGTANNVDHLYDHWMEAQLGWFLFNISDYDSVSLSFYYWAMTAPPSLADYLSVRVSSDYSTWTEIWTQPSMNSSGWQLATVPIPLDTVSVIFYFISNFDSNVDEGVYIDDIVMTATDNIAPESYSIDLPPYCSDSTISMAYNASDVGSGVDYVELYFAKAPSNVYSKYTTSANPTGHWDGSPISFDSTAAGGDGFYKFYTLAIDKFGNQESAPAGYDTSTTIDTSIPHSSAHIDGIYHVNGWYSSSINVNLTFSDNTSGVANVKYNIDTGWWYTYASNFTLSQNGIHTLHFYATDYAGNVESTNDYMFRIDTTRPTIEILAPSNNSYENDGNLTIDWTTKETQSGIHEYEIMLNGSGIMTLGPGNSSFKMNDIADGYYNISIKATDNVGNWNTTKTIMAICDHTKPTIFWTSLLDQANVSGNLLTLSWRTTETLSGIDHYEVSIDYNDWIDTELEATFSMNTTSGWHIVTIRAFDKAGNNDTVTLHIRTSGDEPMADWIYSNAPVFMIIIATIIMGLVALLIMRKSKNASMIEPQLKEEPPKLS